MEILAKGVLNPKGQVEFKYYLDNTELTANQYYSLLEDIEEVEFDDEDDDFDTVEECDNCVCDYNCDNCKYNDIEDSIEDLIEDYKNRIIETNGCPDCIERLLYELVDDLLED